MQITGMRRVGVEFGAVGAVQMQHVAGEFDHGALHAQADAEVGDLVLAGEADGLHLAFDAAHAEAAGDQNSVDSRQQPTPDPCASSSSASIRLTITRVEWAKPA